MKAKPNYYRFGKIGYFSLAAILLLTGCADAVNVQECLSDDPSGFLSGL